MDADETRAPDASDEIDRATRLAQRRGSLRRRALVTSAAIVVVLAAATGTYAFVSNSRSAASGAPQPVASTTSSTTSAPTTTSTVAPTTTAPIPAVAQPKDQVLPDPGGGLRVGSRGPTVLAYEARLRALHFDPGPVDGVFDQDTQYAVTTVQKYVGLPRTGVLDTGVDFALTHFRYTPAEPNSEPDRVEIDLDRQVLTLFSNWQPALLTTTSTGSGEHFCGGVDGCQYAITPTGHFHFYDLVKGWQKGKLGTMWNPYYFNGSDAVHGLQSVPAYPASHGCARIPMHIANYFYALVHQGESVFVVGTPKQAGGGYVGPAPTTPPTTAAPATTAPASTVPTTVVPASTPTTRRSTTTTTRKPPSTTTTTKAGP